MSDNAERFLFGRTKSIKETDMTLSPKLRDELAKLNDAEIFYLLGEILEASIDTPFDHSDDFIDALTPISEAYIQSYSSVRYVASGEMARDKRSDGTMSAAQETAWEVGQAR